MKHKIKSDNFLVQANHFTPQTITCSITDQLLNIPVPVCFFYKKSINHQTLIESLKTVLNDFPIFAGVLKISNWQLQIECNNQGIPFNVVNDVSTLNQILEDLPNLDNNRFIDTFDAKKSISNQSPITTIKLTYFSCGGMALGICWHHAIGDMHTFIQLMKAWSNVFNNKEYVLPLIVNDREAYLQTHLKPNQNTTSGVRYLSISELLKLIAYRPFAARTKTVLRFHFSDRELDNMKQVFSEINGESISKNAALCAHMMSLILKLDSGKERRQLSVVVNYRIKEKLPDAISGNFVTCVNLLVNRKTLSFQLAKELKTAVNHFQDLHMDFFPTKECIENKGGRKKLSRFASIFFNPLEKTLMVTNWSKFDVFDIVFGEAQPFYFTSLSNYPFSWLSSITNGFTNNGLIYSIHLPNKLANKLMQKHNLQQVHQYRDKEETGAELKWLL